MGHFEYCLRYSVILENGWGFSGQVSTVKCLKTTPGQAAVDSRLGRVLVVDGVFSLRRAPVGGNLGKAAAKNGWAGVIVDGCVRDVAELAECDVGIRALASMPLPTENATKVRKTSPCKFKVFGCARRLFVRRRRRYYRPAHAFDLIGW